MLDERDAAAEPTPPVALFPMDLGARTDTETLTDINRDADEFSGGASARDSPLMTLGAPLFEMATHASPTGGSRRQVGAHETPGQRLVAGSHTSRICTTLWKVHSRRSHLISLLGPWPRTVGPLTSDIVASAAVPSACVLQVLKPMQVEGVRWLFAAVHRSSCARRDTQMCLALFASSLSAASSSMSCSARRCS